MKTILTIGFLGASLFASVTTANAQLVIALEGQWDGTCRRGSTVLNTSLIMDQQGGRLNGKTITGLTKGTFSVQFKEGKKTFSGTFSNDTTNLTAKLTADGKEASCSLARKIASSDRLCVRNIDQPQIFFRLDPGTGSTVRLLQGATTQITGSRGGKLCWDINDFASSACPRSLPQSTYAC